MKAIEWYDKGASYFDVGDYDKAIGAYKQVITIQPHNASAHFNLGYAYFLIGNKGAALDEYEILKSLDQDLANKLCNEIYQ